MPAKARAPAPRRRTSTPARARTPARVRAPAARTSARAREAAPFLRRPRNHFVPGGQAPGACPPTSNGYPMNRFNFPDLGIGIGLRTVHYSHILGTQPDVDW